MTVLEVLPKVIRPEKLLGVVALPKLMYINQVLYSSTPLIFGDNAAFAPVVASYDCARELFATIPASVCYASVAWRAVERV